MCKILRYLGLVVRDSFKFSTIYSYNYQFHRVKTEFYNILASVSVWYTRESLGSASEYCVHNLDIIQFFKTAKSDWSRLP
jgi:hypothetical protein